MVGEVVPLHALPISPELNGSGAYNRADSKNCQIDATNDVEAIQRFLAEYDRKSKETQRAYRREVERLLLWAILMRKKPLSGLRRDDLDAYEAFLENPQPREMWCGPKAVKYGPGWRPFHGPLSGRSVNHAMDILNSMFDYLVRAHYLLHNPLALRGRQRRPEPKIAARCFDDDEWNAILACLEPGAAYGQRFGERCRIRAKFIVAALHFLALRASELTKHRMGNFSQWQGDWVFEVNGKGSKEARLPVNKLLLETLREYRRSLGLPELPTPNETTPLVSSVRLSSGISNRRLWDIVKGVLETAASTLEPDKAEHILQASAHWFRHNSITRQVMHTETKADEHAAMNNSRHSSFKTFQGYVHVSLKDQRKLIDRLKWR